MSYSQMITESNKDSELTCQTQNVYMYKLGLFLNIIILIAWKI